MVDCFVSVSNQAIEKLCIEYGEEKGQQRHKTACRRVKSGEQEQVWEKTGVEQRKRERMKPNVSNQASFRS